MSCRLCQGEVKKFLDLGKTPLPEEFRTQKELGKDVKKYPLNLVYCTSCGHVQLQVQVSPDIIYKKNYFYDYSLTKTGLKHWENLAKSIYQNHLRRNDLVVDIGSNTGTLLSIFKYLGSKVLGVDPATRLVKIARRDEIPTINDYFTQQVAKNILKKYGQAKVITCTNTFDHVDDLKEFMKALVMLLRVEGTLIIEVPYFLKMLKNLSHIPYHQQIDYIYLKPLLPFLEKFGFEAFDAEKISFHGGSIRIFIGFKGCHIQSRRLKKLVNEEQISNKSLLKFAKNVLRQKNELTSLVKKLKRQSKTIAGVGASAKGITLLNYCGIGPSLIDFITEKSHLKIGHFTPSGIPIVSDNHLISRKPDYALILAWNFKDEILKNLNQFRKRGGKFIIPIPKIELIT